MARGKRGRPRTVSQISVQIDDDVCPEKSTQEVPRLAKSSIAIETFPKTNETASKSAEGCSTPPVINVSTYASFVDSNDGSSLKFIGAPIVNGKKYAQIV